MRRLLVSSFLAEVTQHIHSLRARGVMPAHTPVTSASDSIALRKSDGILCTVPDEIGCRAIVSKILQVINRFANPAPDFLSERVSPFRVAPKAASWMPASTSVVHASYGGLNDRNGSQLACFRQEHTPRTKTPQTTEQGQIHLQRGRRYAGWMPALRP